MTFMHSVCFERCTTCCCRHPEVGAAWRWRKQGKHGRQAVGTSGLYGTAQQDGAADRGPVLLRDRTGAADGEAAERRNQVQHRNVSPVSSNAYRTGVPNADIWYFKGRIDILSEKPCDRSSEIASVHILKSTVEFGTHTFNSLACFVGIKAKRLTAVDLPAVGKLTAVNSALG